MKNFTLILFVYLLLIQGSFAQNDTHSVPSKEEAHKVIVQEVVQTTNYTYLRVKEVEEERWLAVPKMDANNGETYYYTGSFLMTDFISKELNRTFKEIYFLDKINTKPGPAEKVEVVANPHAAKPLLEKTTIKIEPIAGGITVAELYKNKEIYNGKTVLVKAQVTKFTKEIMDKNWIHLQDGTDFTGNFDITATTAQIFNIGEVIIIEGKVSVSKDFGFGYFYDVIIEDAKLQNK